MHVEVIIAEDVVKACWNVLVGNVFAPIGLRHGRSLRFDNGCGRCHWMAMPKKPVPVCLHHRCRWTGPDRSPDRTKFHLFEVQAVVVRNPAVRLVKSIHLRDDLGIAGVWRCRRAAVPLLDIEQPELIRLVEDFIEGSVARHVAQVPD